MRVFRTGLKVAGLLVLVLVVGLGGAVAALQTRAGKDWLAARLTQLLSTPAQGITVARIHGVVPFQTEIAELRLGARDGEWLTARDIELDIAGGDLLRGRLTLRGRTAADIRVLPRPGPAGGPGKPAAWGPPALP